MNFFHKNGDATNIDPLDIEPGCAFMQEMLNGLSDGTATGITKWYAERHVEGCPHCAAALTGLNRLRVRLKASGAAQGFGGESAPVISALRHLRPDRLAVLEARMNEIDAKEAA
ncbi:MAG: hypothetical protein H7Y38_12335 [Armatimonadetes bacterium]|nr:hypothetical protein [Armatimonadota bacterium]